MNPEQWRWKYFRPYEVLSKDGMRHLERNNLKLQGFALDRLSLFRESLRNPLHCNHGKLYNRGWRSGRENKRIGGVDDSPHCQGIAFDLTCYDISLPALFVYAVMYSAVEKKNKGFRAIGVYPDNNFIHGDFRSFPVKLENYLVIWNRTATVNKAGILPYSEVYPDNPSRTLELLKKKLDLPKKWKL